MLPSHDANQTFPSLADDPLTAHSIQPNAGNVILLAIELTPHRLLRRLTRRQSRGEISAIGVASAYSWIVVANALVVVMCGLGLFLASGQVWRLGLFALLAVAETGLFWWRLGDCLEALADAGDS